MDIIFAFLQALKDNEERLPTHRREREKAAADTLIAGARETLGEIPHLDRLGDEKYRFLPADGLVFHNGRREILINHYWAHPDTARDRAMMQGTWMEKNGVIAVVDCTGHMYLAPAAPRLAGALIHHGFIETDWDMDGKKRWPLTATAVAMGRVGPDDAYIRPKANFEFHCHIQEKLGRAAFELEGHLERFINGEYEDTPRARAKGLTAT